MNKKLLIIPFLLAASISFAQEKDSNADNMPNTEDLKSQMQEVNKEALAFKERYIEPEIKNLKYEVSIRENNKLIMKSVFYLKNGVETIILNKQLSNQNKDFARKNGYVNKEQLISSMEATDSDIGKMEQIKLIFNMDKNKNIYSEFIWKNIKINSMKKIALLEQAAKAAVIDAHPVIDNSEDKVLIVHVLNSETSFMLNEKEFVIKAID